MQSKKYKEGAGSTQNKHLNELVLHHNSSKNSNIKMQSLRDKSAKSAGSANSTTGG